MLRTRIAAVAVVGFCVALAGCSSGGGGSTPPVGSPGPALTLAATSSTTTDEGAGPFGILVSGATAASGAITWSMNPSVGTLVVTSNTQATYTPPAVDVINADTVLTITATPATGSAGSLPVTVRLIPFQQVSATPTTLTQVAPTVAPSITFNRGVDGGSVDATSIDLRSAGGSVPLTRNVAERTVTTTPVQKLAWGSHYALTANASLKSLRGQSLAAPFTLAFDTIAPEWGQPTNIGPSARTSGTPAVGFDDAGNALAVWMRDTDGTGLWNLYYARFSATTRTWSSALPVLASAVAMTEPQLAVLPNGNALLVWQQTSAGTTSIRSSRFDAAGNSWDAPASVHSSSDGIGGLRIAMTSTGVATLAWQRQSLPTAVVTSRYAPATNTWAMAVSPQTAAVSGLNPEVAMDGAGNAYVVWQEGFVAIKASRFSAADNSWSTPQALQGIAGNASVPQVVTDAAGNATAVFVQEQASGPPLLMVARYLSSTGAWKTADGIMPGNGIPKLAIDPAGNVIAVMTFAHGGNVFSVEAARFDATTQSWTPTGPVETISPASFSNPYQGIAFVAVDAAGNAVAAWPRDPGTGFHNLFVARYGAGGAQAAWSTPVHVQSTTANVNGIAAGADRFGNAIVIWGEDVGGVFNPLAARLSGD